MSNIINQPFADVLAKQYPAPVGIKIFTAGEDASKMLAFWSVKQTTKSVVLRVGDSLAKFTLHQCPHCKQDLSAQATKMSQKEREMIQALMALMVQKDASKPAGKPNKKQAAKPAATEPFEPNSADDMTLEQLEALTAPGGGA